MQELLAAKSAYLSHLYKKVMQVLGAKQAKKQENSKVEKTP